MVNAPESTVDVYYACGSFHFILYLGLKVFLAFLEVSAFVVERVFFPRKLQVSFLVFSWFERKIITYYYPQTVLEPVS